MLWLTTTVPLLVAAVGTEESLAEVACFRRRDVLAKKLNECQMTYMAMRRRISFSFRVCRVKVKPKSIGTKSSVL